MHTSSEDFLPPALLREVEEIAAAERRAVRDLLQEAVERYVKDRRGGAAASPRVRTAVTFQEAADRLLERRRGNVLPDGVTIHDLMSHGRA